MDKKAVKVIIPTRKKVALVRQCLKSLVASGAYDEAALDVVVIEGGGEDSKHMIENGKYAARWMPAEEDWSFSQINNAASEGEPVDYLLLMNNDIICKKGFLAEMLKAMEEHSDVGIVGAKLLHGDGTIQHIGVEFKTNGQPYHINYGRKDDGTVLAATRDDYYDAVTFACVLIRYPLWREVGGLSEAYHFNYEDIDFCLKAREKGWKCFVAHRAVLTHLEGRSGADRTTEKHSIWRNLKVFRDRWIVTGRMQDLVSRIINPKHPSMREDNINIAFFPSSKYAGVPWWRIELPAKKLAAKGLANVQVFYADESTEQIVDAVERADVCVFQGFWSEWVQRLASMRDTRPFKMVYDYDDHPIHISPLAQAYRHFGLHEVPMEAADGSRMWLWRDGQDGFDVKRNQENRQRHLEIMHLVDLMTTSTVPLHTYFTESLNPNCVVLPNSIDFDIWKHQYTLWERKPGPVRIGWHGGDNHFHDIKTVGSWLTEYVNSHDVELVLFGAYYRNAFKGIDGSKVIEIPWVHVEAFPATLAALAIDVAVIPLEDPAKPMMGFNGAKSDIKYLEYSSLMVPSLVVEGRAAYACCVDGDNCLTYTDEQTFTEKLDFLCKDKLFRRQLGRRALDWVHEYRDLDKTIYRWAEAYTRLAGGGENPELLENEVEEASV